MYRVIMHRSGWQYYIGGTLQDKDGKPLSDVQVSNVIKIGGTTYEGGSSSIATNSQGKFTIVGGVFPGASQIRCVKDDDTAYVDVYVDWDLPTHQKHDVGTLTVDFENMLSALKSMYRVSFRVEGDHQTTRGSMHGSAGVFKGVLDGLEWDGNDFSIESVYQDDYSTDEETITGTVSDDGRTIVTLQYIKRFRSYNSPGSYAVHEIDTRVTISNVPFKRIYYTNLEYEIGGGDNVLGRVDLSFSSFIQYTGGQTESASYTGTDWYSTSKPALIQIEFID
jgi:hypothetical protein